MLDATNSYAKRIQRVGYCVYTMCYRHTGAAIESGTGTTGSVKALLRLCQDSVKEL